LPTGYDVIVISPPGGPSRDFFHVEFSKSDHDFLIASHCNVLSGMHGFRDNEVFLQVVIVLSPLGAFRTGFVDGIERANPFHNYWFIDTYFTYLFYRFEVIRHFNLAAYRPNCPFRP